MLPELSYVNQMTIQPNTFRSPDSLKFVIGAEMLNRI